jgi:hypothetical protein
VAIFHTSFDRCKTH